MKALPVLSALLVAIAVAFIIYLLHCYVREWRIEKRIRRRVQRARVRYASIMLDLSDSENERRSLPANSAHA